MKTNKSIEGRNWINTTYDARTNRIIIKNSLPNAVYITYLKHTIQEEATIFSNASITIDADFGRFMLADNNTGVTGSIVHDAPLTMIGTYSYRQSDTMQMITMPIVYQSASYNTGDGPKHFYVQVYANNVVLIYKT